MRRALTALSAATVLILTACSDSGSGPDPGDGGTSQAEESPTDDRPAAEVVDDAVDATLAVDALSIATELDLEFGSESFSLTADGGVDYDALVSSVVLEIEQGSTDGQLEIRADGENLWLRTEGDQVPPMPEDATWVRGDAALLADSETFVPEGLIGVLIALRAAEDVEEGETSEVDGVTTREFTTTIAYQDAVDGAGGQAQAFETALSLTGRAEESDLAITVSVGEDDVIRDFDLDVEAPAGIPVDGGYDVEIRDVGAEVADPEIPAEEDTLTGPSADQFLDQVIQ